jgi:hypothetical protein
MLNLKKFLMTVLTLGLLSPAGLAWEPQGKGDQKPPKETKVPEKKDKQKPPPSDQGGKKGKP